MLDPIYVRDNLDAVRTGLESRGLDAGKALEEIATLESARRRLIPEIEGLKREQNTLTVGLVLWFGRKQGMW